MKTQYILPQEAQNKINELQYELAKIELQYDERIHKNIFKERQIRKEFTDNPAVKAIKNEITDIQKRSVEKILITLETEEELMEFKKNWGLKENTHAAEM